MLVTGRSGRTSLAARFRLVVRPVDLTPLVAAAIDSLMPAARAKGLKLQPVLDPSAGPVLGDPDRLQQIFWNLLSNAIKFTAEGGRVQVKLAVVEGNAGTTTATFISPWPTSTIPK